MELSSDDNRIDFVISSSIISLEHTMNNEPMAMKMITRSFAMVLENTLNRSRAPTIIAGMNIIQPIGRKMCGKRRFFMCLNYLVF
jgi:uncharacterized UPF0160 family protein